MRDLRIIYVLVMATALMTCSDSPGSIDGVAQPNPSVELSFVDGNGEDLLNPNHQNYWNEDSLRIYYLKDGEKSRVYNGNLDHPENFKIVEVKDDNNFIMLWLNNHIEEGFTTTFIEFPDGSMDTIKIKARRIKGSVWADKLWYDGELAWEKSEKDENGNTKPRYFIKTKKIN